jgi:hypothetical protein
VVLRSVVSLSLTVLLDIRTSLLPHYWSIRSAPIRFLTHEQRRRIGITAAAIARKAVGVDPPA